MQCSPQKQLISVEIEISTIVLRRRLSFNRWSFNTTNYIKSLHTVTRKLPVNSNGRMERLMCNFHYLGYYCSPNLSIHQNSTKELTWNFLVTLPVLFNQLAWYSSGICILTCWAKAMKGVGLAEAVCNSSNAAQSVNQKWDFKGQFSHK